MQSQLLPKQPVWAHGVVLELITNLKGVIQDHLLKKKKIEAIRVIINLCCCPELPMNHQGNEKLNIYGPFQNWKMRKDGQTRRHVFHHSSTRLGKDLQRNEETEGKAEVIWKWVPRTPSLKEIFRVALEWVARQQKIYINKDEVLQRK